jgi:type VI secretion system protein ImpA
MIDFEQLLTPISDDSPTGNDLRYVDGDLTFQQIEENRAEEDPALVVEGAAKAANWSAVVRECQDAIATKSKDLQLAAWLAEGLAHTEGFAGVRDGLRLARELLQAFWDRLHPGWDDGEIILAIRAKPLSWLGSPRCFVQAVKRIPIATGNPERALCWADFEHSERVDAAQVQTDQSKYQEMLEAGYVSGETWKLAVSNTPIDQLQEFLSGVRECEAELEELTKLCNEQFGAEEAPLLVGLGDLLGEVREFLQKHTATEEGVEGEAAEGATSAGPAAIGGPIASRQQALQSLGQVAAFFRQTEPHSPISYLVQRAVRWGNMPLEDLLKEVVKSSDALEHIWETLGIKSSSSDEGGS